MVKLVVTDKDDRVHEVDAKPGLSIMENIRDLPRSVEAICGGMCACATCHVFVADDDRGRLPARRYEEVMMLRGSKSFDPQRSRLSCQIVVTPELDGLRLTIAPDDY